MNKDYLNGLIETKNRYVMEAFEYDNAEINNTRLELREVRRELQEMENMILSKSYLCKLHNYNSGVLIEVKYYKPILDFGIKQLENILVYRGVHIND